MKCLIRAIRQHEDELSAFLRQRTGDAAIANDLLQDVFLRAISQGEKFCAIEDPRAWLFRVARNVMIDYKRRPQPLTGVLDELPQALSDTPAEPEAVDLLTDCLRRNLARISDDDREIIEFCDLANQTVKSYAQSRSITLSAAKARLLRARRRLRRSLVEHCAVCFDEQGKVCDFTVPVL
ncbi:sigma-70 family RNA polymerase sigma factor [Granulosicoccaceae sp. 1_MG-2023]|nr:sigma-70 family RNA polymerase sigma factor [Granulosicoccaceae sp. 1_MG-2023]